MQKTASVKLGLGRQRQEGQESETSLGYTLEPCLKRKKKMVRKRGVQWVDESQVNNNNKNCPSGQFD